MPKGNSRPDPNLLVAFTLAMAGALVVALPISLIVIWVCA
jgi:hypothetical protein